jgi:hypothetical protein
MIDPPTCGNRCESRAAVEYSEHFLVRQYDETQIATIDSGFETPICGITGNLGGLVGHGTNPTQVQRAQLTGPGKRIVARNARQREAASWLVPWTVR